MISSLSIKNIALIDALNVEFGAGLNVISGETGAGKSILIDSVNFVLGDRADRSLIRYGEDAARVEVVFEVDEREDLLKFFDEYGMDFDRTLIVSRTLNSNGKGDLRVNGRPVPLTVLKKLVALLVDLHGQHENQSLMDVKNHIRLLDNDADGVLPLLENFRAEFANFKSLKKEKSELMNPAERARQIDLLEYQRDEIEKFDLKEGEEETIAEKRDRFYHLEKILSAVNGAAAELNDDSGALHAVSTAFSILQTATRYDTDLIPLSERLDSCKIELGDLADELKSYLETSDFDPRTTEAVEKRFDELRAIKRKYGRTFADIQAFLTETKTKLETLYGADERFSELDALSAASEKKLNVLAEQIYVKRKIAAKIFEESIVKQLCDLGMKHTAFEVSIEHAIGVEDYDQNGGDKVEFLISPNKGEPLKPLQKIASGGELSRFMLALKNITADLDGIDTLIFDEIDTGISGNIAKVVAEKLANIANKRQVLVVTHLAQIAAMSDRNYLIEKSVKGDKTVSEMRRLNEQGVLSEIVRLTGGVEGSTASQDHAKELRAWAREYKKMV